MMQVWQFQIEEILGQLADADFQKRAWAGLIPNEIHSLEESIEMLFGDTGLGEALEAGLVYSAEIDSELIGLESLLKTINPYRPIEEILSDPRLPETRSIAAKALGLLRASDVPRL